MNKCCSHTQTQTILTSKVSVAIQSKGVLNLSNSKSMSESNGTAVASDNIPTISADTRSRIDRLQNIAFDFFAEALELYSLEQLIFCFNGGKDCTVLLHLLMQYCKLHKFSSRAIPMLYIRSDDAFAEIDQFVAYCVKRYDVELIEYKESLKQALTHMSADMPRIKAVFVGSRNTDPYCEHLAPMQPTDNGWPAMMRLNPMLQWSYHDVWHYIHMHNVPYCSLYDQGYTSIGYKSNTVPNPHLERSIENCNCDSDVVCCRCSTVRNFSYKPAWELTDASLERAGRIPKK